MRVRARAHAVLIALVFIASVPSVRGDDAGTVAEPVTALSAQTRAVQQLIEGTLSPSVDARRLFDVPIDDEGAVEIERVRLRALLSVMAGEPALRVGLDAGTAGAPDERVRARLELDRARLAFYDLPRARRDALLAGNDPQRAPAREARSEADRLADAAEAEHQRALAAVKSARSEAERLVAEELVRLIALSRKAASLARRFAGERHELLARVDEVLGWQRRVRETKRSAPADADATYDALRKTLKVRRDDLDVALDRLAERRTELPDPGPDPLARLPVDVGLGKVRARRAALAEDIRRARAEEHALQEERAAILLDETNVLNGERIGLLSYLSSEKRAGITGFTAAGWDQARSELRQLLLIVRYHREIAKRWLPALGSRGGASWVSVLGASVPWIILVLGLAWWRRQAAPLFEALEQRIAEQDRLARRTTPSGLFHLLRFLHAIERPFTRLAFFGLGVWLLPSHVQSLLEVQLLVVIVGWTMAGSLIVVTLLAVEALGQRTARTRDPATDQLRLRSLRLVGRVVVVFSLVLVLSARLVGQGTVYSWVSRTCWLAALPVFFVLVRWWRETVFARIADARPKRAWHGWVLAHRTGFRSFLAATVGGVHLFAAGTLRAVRGWVTRFTLTRRADAYLFRRELDRLASEPAVHLRALGEAVRVALGPDAASDVWLDGPVRDVFQAIAQRLDEGRGGVIAIVGARGMGKTSLLLRLRTRAPVGETLTCRSDTSAAVVAAAVSAHEGDGRGVLHVLDDADASIRPMLGGLRAFDEILALARERDHTQPRALWVFALDSVIWPYLRRARDHRPLFDKVFVLEPWTDEQIGSLLAQRSAAAGIDPAFDDLLEKQRHARDELELIEALAEKRAGYVRVIWDYARGNPAIALEVWRSSLVEDDRGRVRARPLSVPSAAVLEHLPDSVLFILRAILQMAPATAADVMQATRLPEDEVQNAFRFGQRHGYLVEEDGRVRVPWWWLRLVLVLLERRHLLVEP